MQQNWNAPGGQSGGVAPHRGVVVLTLGILGLIICAPLGVVAWVMGRKDLAEMRAGRMDPSGMGLTQAGYITGIIGSIFLILGLLAAILGLVIAGLGLAFSSP